VTAADWVIIALLALSTVEGLRRGLIAALFSLGGFILGFFLAGKYWYLALPVMRRLVSQPWIAELCCFLLVLFLVIIAASLLGHMLRRTAHALGLGWIDRLLGGAFGLLRGVLVVVLGFIIVAAFFPAASWTHNSRLAPFFLSTAQRVMQSAPAAAANRVVLGVQELQQHTRSWR
jgi:membrane protein required for colicin V production